MKNHKINYKKYITLVTVLAMTFVGVATVSENVNNTKYEVADTTKVVEQVVTTPETTFKVAESEPEVVAEETQDIWQGYIDNTAKINVERTANGLTNLYTFTKVASLDGKYDIGIEELNYGNAIEEDTNLNNSNSAWLKIYIPRNVNEDTTFKHKLSADVFEGIIAKDVNLPTAKYTVKQADNLYDSTLESGIEVGTDLYDVQITSDGYLILDNFNVATIEQSMDYQLNNEGQSILFDTDLEFVSADLRPEIKFLDESGSKVVEAPESATFERVEGDLPLDFDPHIGNLYGNITTASSQYGFNVDGGQFNEVLDGPGYEKVVEKTGEVDWNTPGVYEVNYVLSYKNPLPRFDVQDTYKVTVTITPKAVVEVPKPDTPEPETGVSTPELSAEPIKLPLENRDFKGLEELIYEAYDSKDGNLNSKVKIKSGTVNLSKIGSYTLVLEVTNSDGNTAVEQVVVEVFEVEPEAPETPDVPETPEVDVPEVIEPEPETPEPEAPELEVPEVEALETPDVEEPKSTTPDVEVEPKKIKVVEKVDVTNDLESEPVKEAETAKEQAKQETLEAEKEEVTAATKFDKKDGPKGLLQTDIKPLNPTLSLLGGIALVVGGLYFFKKSFLLLKKSIVNLKNSKK